MRNEALFVVANDGSGNLIKWMVTISWKFSIVFAGIISCGNVFPQLPTYKKQDKGKMINFLSSSLFKFTYINL